MKSNLSPKFHLNSFSFSPEAFIWDVFALVSVGEGHRDEEMRNKQWNHHSHRKLFRFLNSSSLKWWRRHASKNNNKVSWIISEIKHRTTFAFLVKAKSRQKIRLKFAVGLKLCLLSRFANWFRRWGSRGNHCFSIYLTGIYFFILIPSELLLRFTDDQILIRIGGKFSINCINM